MSELDKIEADAEAKVTAAIAFFHKAKAFVFVHPFLVGIVIGAAIGLIL